MLLHVTSYYFPVLVLGKHELSSAMNPNFFPYTRIGFALTFDTQKEGNTHEREKRKKDSTLSGEAFIWIDKK